MDAKDYILMTSINEKLKLLAASLDGNRFVCIPGHNGDEYIPIKDIKKVVVSPSGSFTIHVYENSLGSVTEHVIVKPSDIMVFKTTVLGG